MYIQLLVFNKVEETLSNEYEILHNSSLKLKRKLKYSRKQSRHDQYIRTLGNRESNVKRKVCRYANIHQKEERTHINHLTAHLQKLENTKQKEGKSDKRKEIIKFRPKMNKTIMNGS